VVPSELVETYGFLSYVWVLCLGLFDLQKLAYFYIRYKEILFMHILNTFFAIKYT